MTLRGQSRISPTSPTASLGSGCASGKACRFLGVFLHFKLCLSPHSHNKTTISITSKAHAQHYTDVFNKTVVKDPMKWNCNDFSICLLAWITTILLQIYSFSLPAKQSKEKCYKKSHFRVWFKRSTFWKGTTPVTTFEPFFCNYWKTLAYVTREKVVSLVLVKKNYEVKLFFKGETDK